LGIRVRLDWTWFFLAFLIVWSLSTGYFPANYPGFTFRIYLTMGLVGAIGLFASIVAHEFCHALVGRHYGLPITDIKLFIFGGVAEMHEEPDSAKSEALMAIAGPAASVVIGVVCNLLSGWGSSAGWPLPITATLSYLGLINIFLAIFNMIPAYPLDGGRVLRALLWGLKRDLRWATRVASRIGSGFGFVLIALGVVSFLGGNFVGGLWSVLIGFFLQSVSSASYQNVLIKEFFKGEPIRKFAKTDLVTVGPELALSSLVENYFYKTFHQLYPVVENDNLMGCISLEDVGRYPREEWERLKVHDVMTSCGPENTVFPETDVSEVLRRMTSERRGRFVIVDHDGHLLGLVSLKDLMNAISIQMQLLGGRRAG
jgi:Zn-dependent protease